MKVQLDLSKQEKLNWFLRRICPADGDSADIQKGRGRKKERRRKKAYFQYASYGEDC